MVLRTRDGEAEANAAGEEECQDDEADSHGNVQAERGRDHLERNPRQNAGKCPGKRPESICHRLVDEEQSSQSEDGEYVARIGDEAVG